MLTEGNTRTVHPWVNTSQCGATCQFLVFTIAFLCLSLDHLENWVFTQLKWLVIKVLENTSKNGTHVGCTDGGRITTDVGRWMCLILMDSWVLGDPPQSSVLTYNFGNILISRADKLQVEITQVEHKNQQKNKRSLMRLGLMMSDLRWRSAQCSYAYPVYERQQGQQRRLPPSRSFFLPGEGSLCM